MRRKTAILALGIGLLLGAYVLVPAAGREINEFILQARAWIFTALQTFSAGVASPLAVKTDYSMAAPATAPTVVTSGTASVSCVNTNTHNWYTSWVNESGVSALSQASLSWVPSTNFRKPTITRPDAPPANAKGWLVWMQLNGGADRYLESTGGLNGAATLESALNASGTSTATVHCGTSSALLYAAQTQSGPRTLVGIDSISPGVISFPSWAGGSINLLTENARRLSLGNTTLQALQMSFDSGVTNLLIPPSSVTERHVCKAGCVYATVQSAIDSITDEASNKRYTVIIHPGDYAETITVPSYVSLAGTDRNSVRVDRVVFADDATEIGISNLTALAIGRFGVATVRTTVWVVGCNVGVLSGSFGQAPGDERAIWAQELQDLYSVGNFIRGHWWGLATYVDGTVYSSGDTILIDGSNVDSNPSRSMGIGRDEGGERIYASGANIVINSAEADQTIAGVYYVLAPGNVGTRASVIRVSSSTIRINQTNASATGDLSCIHVPEGTGAETGALATRFEFIEVDCEIESASSSGTLRGVYFPADADHINWTVVWKGGRIALSGGATRWDVDNQETASGASATLTEVVHVGAYTGAGTTIVNGQRPVADVGSTCKKGSILPDDGGATDELCVCVADGVVKCVSLTNTNPVD